MQRSATLSSMGPADMVPCLELSVTALKCREKSVRKVHTSSYKRLGREITRGPSQAACGLRPRDPAKLLAAPQSMI